MSDTPDILHEEDVRAVIEDEIESGVGHTANAISDVAAPSVGYVQAEAAAARTAINSILSVLRANGIIASS